MVGSYLYRSYSTTLENSNNEMIKVMESLQWTYLNLVEILEKISWEEDHEEACPADALAAQLSMFRLW